MIRTNTLATAAAVIAASATLAACGSMDAGRATARASLAPTAAIAPNPTTGTATFTALAHGVRVAGEVRGLPPGSEHGFHIHEKGDCGDNGNASGGHFNPAGGTHGKFGAQGSHAGELPSLVADAAGVARFSADVPSISLADGAANNVVGRALVVHRDRDDFTTQPAGNSGPRIACAVITRD
ncbi:superoxide dismutase family protein [Alicycliphilus denitrificans]|uniref:superoxide dismutase family protein n=1 Tax=Alicycliphilus denitrificans TaxID=179636 RepID=UPI003A80F6F1